MRVRRLQKTDAFSLVELMVVVAIIGVLAALAIPRFKTFQAKARQAEAKTNLAHLYTLEQSYHGDHDSYIDMGAGQECESENPLGFYFKCEGGGGTTTTNKKRYYYEVSDASSTQFTGWARSSGGGDNKVLPGCPPDVWTVNESKMITGVDDQVVKCAD